MMTNDVDLLCYEYINPDFEEVKNDEIGNTTNNAFDYHYPKNDDETINISHIFNKYFNEWYFMYERRLMRLKLSSTDINKSKEFCLRFDSVFRKLLGFINEEKNVMKKQKYKIINDDYAHNNLLLRSLKIWCDLIDVQIWLLPLQDMVYLRNACIQLKRLIISRLVSMNHLHLENNMKYSNIAHLRIFELLCTKFNELQKIVIPSDNGLGGIEIIEFTKYTLFYLYEKTFSFRNELIEKMFEEVHGLL